MPCFTMQKAVFHALKGRLSEGNIRSFTKVLYTYCLFTGKLIGCKAIVSALSTAHYYVDNDGRAHYGCYGVERYYPVFAWQCTYEVAN